MEFQQTDFTIDFLIRKIRTGGLALPDFQRDFVWSPSQVVELLDSVSRQWPIGSLLLLTGPQTFAFRPVHSGPVISAKGLDLYVLDGQQRVTALFHAIADVSDFTYYIDFRRLLNGEDEPIAWAKRSEFERDYPDIDARAKAKIALVSDVWDAPRFYEWLKCIPNESEHGRLLQLRESRLSGFHSNVYTIFAIKLERSIELEALARIFETLNRTGVALNAFDLMVAALYPKGFHLRDEWNNARDEYEILRSFAPDELELLKLVALIARITDGRKAARGVRQGDLLRMDRSLVRKYWPQAVQHYVKGLRYAAEKFGVSTREVVPSWTMLLGLACLLYMNAPDVYIRRWWFTRVISQSYGQAANTMIVADVDGWTSPMDILFPFILESQAAYLEAPARSNGLLMRGLGAFIVSEGGCDPLTGHPLSASDRLAFRALDEEGECIRRLNTSDRLNQLVVVTGETDRRMGRSMSLDDIPSIQAHLRTQGLERFERDKVYAMNLIRLASEVE